MRKKRESKHFSRLWRYVSRAVMDAFDECDEKFIVDCNVTRRNATKETEIWKAAVEDVYRSLRSELEIECYGTDDHESTLDPSKTAAVVCCALIKKKAISFNEDSALAMLKQKESVLQINDVAGRIRLNHWIVDNFFVNYKIAYLSGLMILFDTMLGELLHNSETLEYGKKLANLGCIHHYPGRSEFDNFDVNFVLGLGRSDMKQKEINTFFLASHFYQMEMYTRIAIGLDRTLSDHSVS